ncbi:Hypothetical protein LUCI_1966 [Lucifera butyrica]|uniref:DUF2971 domain-containing protein n=1 Tax=Lucifera butyrica TaxID=1351585 RepID=A0A498R735_9FIRM|nr:DUF2971 domain-containing protein [Lucifera butyrica]VBB06730.1 Hypothetical protein LUCI_1966 [Lucifera butyrica]
METRPPKLYKYCPWNDYAKDILLENRVYFNSAESFNDPFDGNVVLADMDGAMEKWLERFKRAFAAVHNRNLTEEEQRAIGDTLAKMSLRERKQYFEKNIVDVLRKAMGICCFSAENRNIVMWSHYADNHKGICLEFNHSNSGGFGASKVSYYAEYPSLNYISASDAELSINRFCIKAVDWQYEQEYRVIMPNKAKAKIPFPPELLVGVIAGCCMPDEKLAELIGLLENRLLPITLYKARKKEREFGLDIARVGDYGLTSSALEDIE